MELNNLWVINDKEITPTLIFTIDSIEPWNIILYYLDKIPFEDIKVYIKIL